MVQLRSLVIIIYVYGIFIQTKVNGRDDIPQTSASPSQNNQTPERTNPSAMSQIFARIGACFTEGHRQKLILPKGFTGFNLNTLTPQTLRYYKHAMLLFCQVCNYKLLNEPLDFPKLTELRDFDDNEEVSGDWYVRYKLALGHGKHKPYKDLLNLCAEVLNNYDRQIIIGTDFVKKVLYHNLLDWLVSNTDGNEEISTVVDKIILSGKVKNFWRGMFFSSMLKEIIDSSSERLKTLQGWLARDQYVEVFLFLYQYVVKKIEIQNIKMHCTDIEIYDHFIACLRDESLEGIFQETRYQLLEIVDEVFFEKSKESITTSPYVKALEDDKIDLSLMEKDTTEYLKHAFILFYSAIERRLKLELLDSEHLNELRQLPTRMGKQSKLRYCYSQLLFATVIDVMIKKMEEHPPNIEGAMDKMFLERRLFWLDHQFKTKKYRRLQRMECPKFRTAVLEFGVVAGTNHLLTDIMALTKYASINPDHEEVQTLNQLLTTGEEIDDATNVLLLINVAELGTKITAIKDEMKSLSLDLNDQANATKFEELELSLTVMNNRMTKIIQYGLPEKMVKCRNINVYTRILTNAHEDTFFEIFFKTRQEVLKQITNALTNVLIHNDTDENSTPDHNTPATDYDDVNFDVSIN